MKPHTAKCTAPFARHELIAKPKAYYTERTFLPEKKCAASDEATHCKMYDPIFAQHKPLTYTRHTNIERTILPKQNSMPMCIKSIFGLCCTIIIAHLLVGCKRKFTQEIFSGVRGIYRPRLFSLRICTFPETAPSISFSSCSRSSFSVPFSGR